MELKVIETKDVPLLSRKRVTLMATFSGPTPARDVIRDSISKQLKVDKKLTIVRHIYTKYGNQSAKVITHIYDNEKDMKEFEDKHTVKKHEIKEKKKEEAPAEEKLAEAPKEEKKEEPAEKKEAPKKEKPAEKPEEPKAEEKSE